ncbi:MAG: VanZ family protein [Desulfobacterales bacterium]|nr:VanZ family protein [Desulfobacterales bacterium]
MQKILSRILLYWFPLAAYCGLIFFMSSRPAPEQIPQFFCVDKLIHMGEYGLLSMLFYRAYGTTTLYKKTIRLVILSILSAGLYGISDEFHQAFNPTRHPSIADIIADFSGACLGVWLYHYIALYFPVLTGNHRLTR